MKLLNLNICIKLDNTDEVIKLLEKEAADICALQEVMNGTDESCFEMYKLKNKLIKIKNYKFNEFAPLFIAKGVSKNGIITRDFNLLPNTKSIKLINDKMNNLIDEYNIKTTRPTFNDGLDKGDLVCDYIFVNDKVKVNDFKVLNNNSSDHLPLLLDFEI